MEDETRRTILGIASTGVGIAILGYLGSLVTREKLYTLEKCGLALVGLLLLAYMHHILRLELANTKDTLWRMVPLISVAFLDVYVAKKVFLQVAGWTRKIVRCLTDC